ncbi:MAG: hypothetical protein EBS07_10355 [Sphingobacteriia bacterium]|nr:hypothetical protein [Sphingobacteriia bacterium]
MTKVQLYCFHSIITDERLTYLNKLIRPLIWNVYKDQRATLLDYYPTEIIDHLLRNKFDDHFDLTII